MLHFPPVPDLATQPQLHPAHRLLARAHPPGIAAEIFESKVQRRPLLITPNSSQPDPDSKDARAARRARRLRSKEHHIRHRKPRPLSAKERRKMRIHDIPDDPASRRYSTYLPLRDLWLGYIREVLEISPQPGQSEPQNRSSSSSSSSSAAHSYFTGASAGPKLASADYHGAEVQVVRSSCVSRVGLKGIVLKDTKFTFELITAANEIKTVPKAGTVFRFEIPRTLTAEPHRQHQQSQAGGNSELAALCDDEMSIKNEAKREDAELMPLIFELHGNHFEIRAAERATKKFKPKNMDHL